MNDSDKRPKRTRYTSPTGIAVFPKLNTPDTKFNAGGVYTVKLKLKKGDESTDRIVKLIEDAAQAAFEAETEAHKGMKDKKGKPVVVGGPESPIAVELDKVTNEETGYILINFKMNASYKDKKNGGVLVPIKPKLYDAKGNETNVEVWGGTEGKVAFELIPYFVESSSKAGVSCRLSAFQIIKLRTKGSDGNAAMYGFKAEDGFESMPEMGDEVPSAPVTTDGATNAAKGQF